MSTFEVYKDKKGETRFRYKAGNGEVVFSSESYKSKASAMKSIESLQKNVASATIEERKPAEKKASAKAETAKGAAKGAKANGDVKKAKSEKPAAEAKPAKSKAKAVAKPAKEKAAVKSA